MTQKWNPSFLWINTLRRRDREIILKTFQNSLGTVNSFFHKKLNNLVYKDLSTGRYKNKCLLRLILQAQVAVAVDFIRLATVSAGIVDVSTLLPRVGTAELQVESVWPELALHIAWRTQCGSLMLPAPEGGTFLYVTASFGTVVAVSTGQGEQVTVIAGRRAQERKDIACYFEAPRLTADAGSSGFKFPRGRKWDARVLFLSGRRHSSKDNNRKSCGVDVVSVALRAENSHVGIAGAVVACRVFFACIGKSDVIKMVLAFGQRAFWRIKAAATGLDAAGLSLLEMASAACRPCHFQIRMVRRVVLGM